MEEFNQFVELPENAKKLFEFIGGEIVEAPSNVYASYLGGRVFRRIANHVEDNDLGYATGEAGGYLVPGERSAPSQPEKVVKIDGVLNGGNILPGFKLAVKDIFPPDPPTSRT